MIEWVLVVLLSGRCAGSFPDKTIVSDIKFQTFTSEYQCQQAVERIKMDGCNVDAYCLSPFIHYKGDPKSE